VHKEIPRGGGRRQVCGRLPRYAEGKKVSSGGRRETEEGVKKKGGRESKGWGQEGWRVENTKFSSKLVKGR